MPADPNSQHMQALKRANDVRLGIAEAKRKIVSGELTPDRFVDEPVLQPARVMDVLTAQHRWGRTRARKFLASVPRLMRSIESTRLSELTVRERRVLRKALEEEAACRRNGKHDEGGQIG